MAVIMNVNVQMQGGECTNVLKGNASPEKHHDNMSVYVYPSYPTFI